MYDKLVCRKKEGRWVCEVNYRPLDLHENTWADVDFNENGLAFWYISKRDGSVEDTDQKWYVIARVPGGGYVAVENDVDEQLTGIGYFDSLSSAAVAIVKRLLEVRDVSEEDAVEVSDR